MGIFVESLNHSIPISSFMLKRVKFNESNQYLDHFQLNIDIDQFLA